jgi:hypothetical protein
MDMGDLLHAPAILPLYPFDRRLDRPHSRSRRGGEEKKSLPRPYQESNPGFPGCSLAVYTELRRKNPNTVLWKM